MAVSWRKRVSLSRALRCQLWGTQTLAVNMGVTVPSSRDRHMGPPGERMLPPLGLPQLRPGHPAMWFLPSRRSRFYFSHSRRWHPGCRLEEGEGQQWTCHTCLLIRTPSRPCLGHGRPQLGALMQPTPKSERHEGKCAVGLHLPHPRGAGAPGRSAPHRRCRRFISLFRPTTLPHGLLS